MADQIDWKNLFSSWDGRIRRSHFWIGMIIVGAANMIAGAIPLLGAILSFLLIAPAGSLAVQRLHDMSRSAKFAIIPLASSAAAVIVSVFTGGALAGFGAAGMLALAPSLLLLSALLLVNLAFVLWIGFTPGVPRPNAYGPDPRSPSA